MFIFIKTYQIILLNFNNTILNKNTFFLLLLLASKNTDPMSLLSIDFTKSYEYSATQLKKSIFKQLICAITELKLEIKITEEDIKNANEKRQIRANNLSLALSTK